MCPTQPDEPEVYKTDTWNCVYTVTITATREHFKAKKGVNLANALQKGLQDAVIHVPDTGIRYTINQVEVKQELKGKGLI